MAERADFAVIARDRARSWRRIAFLMCGDWARAEDLVQQAMMRMYVKWHRIDPAGIDAYARKVITRLAIDESRRPYRRHERGDELPDDLPHTSPNPDDVMVVRAALQRVPPKQRATIVLRFYQELSVAETAAALGVSEGTVKSQTARGLATLRQHLSPDYLASYERMAVTD